MLHRFIFLLVTCLVLGLGYSGAYAAPSPADLAEQARGAYNRQDYTKAAELYLKAAELGNSYAQWSLGTLYYKGLGVPQSDGEAFLWFQEAAAQGDAAGQAWLANCYYYGRGAAMDYAKAFEWYSKSAAQGNAGGQSGLAGLYRDGKGIDQNYDKTVELFKAAAAQGRSDAERGLAYMYARGWGLPRDYTKVATLFESAAQKGDSVAQYEIGRLYHEGLGVPQNYAKALEWYTKSAQAGSAEALYYLGLLYAENQDYSEAVRCFTRLTKGKPHMLALLQTEADKGHAGAQYVMGYLYYFGENVPVDITEAVKWHTLAAENGVVLSQSLLSSVYGEGLKGIEKDPVKALRWLNAAAGNGDLYSQYNLARLLYLGSPHTAKNLGDSWLWAQTVLNGDPADGELLAATRQLLIAVERDITLEQRSIALGLLTQKGLAEK